METKPYYNTNTLSGNELKEAVSKALKQEQAVFLIYLNTRQAWTVSDIYGMCQRAGHSFIKVSIGRAVTNLFNKGELIKLPNKKKGMHNAPEGYYQLNFLRYPSPPLKQISLFE